MSYYLILLEDGTVILGIHARGVTVGATAGLFYEVAGTIQVFLVAGHLVELAECHLNDGMAARAVDLTFRRTECLAHQVGVLDRHIEHRALACGQVVGHGRLNQVPGVV